MRLMHVYYVKITVFAFFIYTQYVRANDIAREVEGGVQLLKVGPIQLIVSDVLAFTIKNYKGCQGNFRICYVYKLTVTRDDLKNYVNVGGNCPSGSCTLIMSPLSGSVYGLGPDRHDGNFYGVLSEGSGVTCPRHSDNGRSNFTVLELPNCPVIVDGAMLPKDEETEPKTAKSSLWIIPVCVGLLLLIIGAIIIGLYFWIRSKKKPVPQSGGDRHDQRLRQKSAKSMLSHHRKSISKRSQPKTVVSASPKTPTSKKRQIQEDSAPSNDNI